METAELTKSEQAHVERMSEPFSESSMQERFEAWAGRAITEGKQDEKERAGSRRPREISMKDRPDEEREFIEAVGLKAESKDSGKAPRREESTEKETAGRAEQHPDPKTGEKPAASEPLSGDRHWQGKLEGKDLENHASRVNSRIGVALEHINQHPQKAEIHNGFRALFAGKPAAQQQAFFQDLTTCLAEVGNPGEVLRHITVQPQDREYLRNVKNWQELRAAVQTIAKQYPATASQPSPKPRAPKPPSEVGGRGAAGDDGTRSAENFVDFSARQARQAQRYGRHA